MENVLQQVYFKNSVQDYLISFGSIILGVLIVRIFQQRILKRLKRWAEGTETSFDDYLVGGIERFGLPVTKYLIIYAGLNYLNFSVRGEKILHVVTIVIITFYVISMIVSLLKVLLESHVRKQEKGEEKVKQLRGVVIVISIVIWGLGFVFLFDNLGYDVTAVITGLGIGGIAIALAAQNILGDLFNYFVIFFDRPFEIGDSIVVDDKNGVVEFIGIKTTRLKAVGGEQLILSNSDITKSRVHNFKRMQRRRILFSIGVVYQTSLENIREIPTIIREIIEENELATVDRVHFSSYGSVSLNFETVYYVESPEYNKYMDLHQRINIRIFEVFQQRGIQFATSAQTIVLVKEQTVSTNP